MSARLRIAAAGPTVSLQDRGRYGGRRYGVSLSGPMDDASHALALALAGADADAPAFEFGPGGMSVEAKGAPLRLAVAGPGAGGVLTRKGLRSVLPAPFVAVIEPGDGLAVRPGADGSWGTLAVAGLDAGERVLGSHATNLRTGLGPPRPDAGSTYPCPAAAPEPARLFAEPLPRPEALVVRLLAAPQTHLFDAASREALVSREYTITRQRDRMGGRIEGPPLRARSHDIVSDALVKGAIQVPGDGQPIVQTADAAPTGGYPKIAVVARADLPLLVQARAPSPVRFRWIEIEEARAASLALQRAIEGVAPRRRAPLDPDFLKAFSI